MNSTTQQATKSILTKVRERASEIHGTTGKSPLKLILGKQEWDEFCEFAAREWMVFPKTWQANYIAGIRITAWFQLPRGIYSEYEAEQAIQNLAAKDGSEAAAEEGE